MYRIYLVEDEPNLNEVLATYLRNEGWLVRPFVDGEAARRAIAERPDLWILDIMLPGADGYQLIREIKADSPRLPVVFISARDADMDRIAGLELGSDDYVPKPFLPRELVIRVKRLLERVYMREKSSAEAVSEGKSLLTSAPPYMIDPDARHVFGTDGTVVELTSKEFDLLLYVAEQPGRLLERNQLLDALWGADYFGSDRVVDDLIRRVRRKLPLLRLETVYGFGYRLVKQ